MSNKRKNLILASNQTVPSKVSELGLRSKIMNNLEWLDSLRIICFLKEDIDLFLTAVKNFHYSSMMVSHTTQRNIFCLSDNGSCINTRKWGWGWEQPSTCLEERCRTGSWVLHFLVLCLLHTCNKLTLLLIYLPIDNYPKHNHPWTNERFNIWILSLRASWVQILMKIQICEI